VTSTLYYVNVIVHVLAAMLWLGGMLFIGLIGAPVLRALDPPALREKLFHQLGVRFRTAGWLTIAVLIATGVANLYYKGWLRWDGVLGSPDFWRTTSGLTLGVKLVGVGAMLIVSALHDFVLGPRAGRGRLDSPEAKSWRRSAAALARVNALLGVVVVAAAVLLARGA
jgi:uncharacterized membrane protein